MTNNYIKLNDVRLSFPSLFKPKSYNGESKPKYEATFILDKVYHAKEINAINAKIDELLQEKKLSRAKIKSDHLCFKDGDLGDREENKGAFTLKSKSARKFPIIGADAVTRVTEDESPFYGGCYVSAYIDLWIYDERATGVGATLKSIQFRKEGEPFGTMEREQDITGIFDPVVQQIEEEFF